MSRGLRRPKPDPRIIGLRQVLPADFAEALRRMRGERDPRLSPTLSAAYNEGWTATALGDALGVSREAVLQRILKSKGRSRMVNIPPPPRRPDPEPRPGRPEVPGEIADQLRALSAAARTVNGATAADDPRRQSSVELSALLAQLNDDGFSLGQLGEVLGVTPSAVLFRLSRHGYRNPPPSQSTPYKGEPTAHVGRSHCKRGHPLTAENLYLVKGGRMCRACSLARSRRSYLRRRGQVAA
jgi:biotin operon repressor